MPKSHLQFQFQPFIIFCYEGPLSAFQNLHLLENVPPHLFCSYFSSLFYYSKKIRPLRSLDGRPGKSVTCTPTISITLISDYKNASLFEAYTNPEHLATRTTESCRATPNILNIIFFLILLHIRTTDHLQIAKDPVDSDVHM